jgi:hypothetical protein
MAAFQFYLQSGKQRNVGWAGDNSYNVFGKRFRGKKGSVRRVRCRDANASSFVAKVRGEIFANFHADAMECQGSFRALTVWPVWTNSL